jgi:hypothetical protein
MQEKKTDVFVEPSTPKHSQNIILVNYKSENPPKTVTNDFNEKRIVKSESYVIPPPLTIPPLPFSVQPEKHQLNTTNEMMIYNIQHPTDNHRFRMGTPTKLSYVDNNETSSNRLEELHQEIAANVRILQEQQRRQQDLQRKMAETQEQMRILEVCRL